MPREENLLLADLTPYSALAARRITDVIPESHNLIQRECIIYISYSKYNIITACNRIMEDSLKLLLSLKARCGMWCPLDML